MHHERARCWPTSLPCAPSTPSTRQQKGRHEWTGMAPSHSPSFHPVLGLGQRGNANAAREANAKTRQAKPCRRTLHQAQQQSRRPRQGSSQLARTQRRRRVRRAGGPSTHHCRARTESLPFEEHPAQILVGATEPDAARQDYDGCRFGRHMRSLSTHSGRALRGHLKAHQILPWISRTSSTSAAQ